MSILTVFVSLEGFCLPLYLEVTTKESPKDRITVHTTYPVISIDKGCSREKSKWKSFISTK